MPTAPAGTQAYDFILSAEEDSIWEGNAPTSPSIETAFANAITASNAAIQAANGNGSVAFLSPQARIVRSFNTGALRANVTRATNVLVVNAADPATAQNIATVVGTQLDTQLASVGNWQPTLVTVFDPAVNGDLSWWTCQGVALTAAATDACSAVTQTRDAFPELAARLQANENATGPTTALTHPQTVGTALGNLGTGLGNAATSVASAGMWVAAAAAVGVVLVLAVKHQPSKTQEAAVARKNPKRLNPLMFATTAARALHTASTVHDAAELVE